MKIQSVGQICKKDKTAVLFDSEDGRAQWIGDGYAMYPILGLPYLREESVFTIFGISEKDRDKWNFCHREMPEEISFEDSFPGEQLIKKDTIYIGYHGKALKPMQTSQGMEFIESRYLAPLKDVMDTVEFYERISPHGQIYIAVKTGWLLAAVILPYDVISHEFVDKLDDLTRKCAQAVVTKERRKASAAVNKPMQIKYDRETGEVLEPHGDEA